MNNTIEENYISTVSVVIPAYNAEKYIAEAIDSVLKQTLRPNEIIVVDDGSTDHTAKIIKTYENKVRYLYQNNSGPSAARNKGIKAAHCEWIAFLDADDTWVPEKLEKQLSLLQREKSLVWATCNYFLDYTNHQKILFDPDKLNDILKGREYIDSCFTAIKSGSELYPSSMIIKRAIFDQVGLFQEKLWYSEDHDLWWRIGYRWPKLGFVKEPLANYHAGREGSLTTTTSSRKILSTISDIFVEHLELAAQCGKQEEIKPLVIRKLKKWLYINYRRKEFGIVKETLRRHRNLFSASYTNTLMTLTSMPTFTVRGGIKLLELLRYNKS